MTATEYVKTHGRETVAWYGVRNYQARNFMRDQMQVGDQAFFYHSSCPEPGIAGIVRISKAAYPDASQFDKKSKYFDSKATRDAPRWAHDLRVRRQYSGEPVVPVAVGMS